MSSRLGAALAGHVLALPGERKFVVVEGVSEEIAESMAAAWSDSELRLAIVSTHPGRFGARALADDVAATGLRNQDGVCLVLCEGAQIADRQSLRAFPSAAPGDLLRDHAGLTRLAQIAPAAPLDGPMRHVRAAILQAGAASRPSAAAVAAYLDRCAAHENPLSALPTLGGFADHLAGDAADQRRIMDNLALAAAARRGDYSRPGDLRRRAARVIGQRPGTTAAQAKAEAARLLALLQSGDEELLSALTYDEATEILEQKSRGLPAAAAKELDFYRSERSEDPGIAWERYENAVRGLRDPEQERECAQELLGFDDVESRRVFDSKVRRRLEQVLKDPVMSASRPSCPELALVKTAVALGKLSSIEVLSPAPSDRRQQNRTNATQRIAVACARLRLSSLMRDLQLGGVRIDGALLLPADEGLWEDIFQDAQLEDGGGLPTVLLRLRSEDESTSRQISWRPDLDDVAALRAAMAFAEQPALMLRASSTPGLRAFCGGPSPSPVPPSPALAGLADHLHRLAKDALQHGLGPGPLEAWAHEWARAVERARAAGETTNAEELALAAAPSTPPPAAARYRADPALRCERASAPSNRCGRAAAGRARGSSARSSRRRTPPRASA
jgi:hypothetical protein